MQYRSVLLFHAYRVGAVLSCSRDVPVHASGKHITHSRLQPASLPYCATERCRALLLPPLAALAPHNPAPTQNGGQLCDTDRECI